MNEYPYLDQTMLADFASKANDPKTFTLKENLFRSFATDQELKVSDGQGYFSFDSNLNIAYVESYLVVSGSSSVHYVHLTHTPTESGAKLQMQCGNNWLTGKAVQVEDREELAKDLAQQIYTDPEDQAKLVKSVLASRNVLAIQPDFMAETACHFWRHIKSNNSTIGCKHCRAVLEKLSEKVTSAGLPAKSPRAMAKSLDLFEKRAQARFEGFKSNAIPAPVSMPGPTTFAPKSSKGRTMDRIDHLLDQDAIKAPHFFIGEPGSGKSHKAYFYAERHELPIFTIAGNSDTRPTEFTGHWVDARGRWIWKDGKLSQAIRMAQTQKVVLLIDEMLRIDPDNLSVLYSLLAPSDRFYSHGTGKMLFSQQYTPEELADENLDIVGTEEVLKCPIENLVFFATSNLGAQYGVNHIDPALKRRFRIIELKNSAASVKAVTQEKLTERGFAGAETLAGKLADLYTATENAVKANLIAEKLNLGILSRCINASTTVAELRTELEKEMYQYAATSASGEFNQSQMAKYKTILASCLR